MELMLLQKTKDFKYKKAAHRSAASSNPGRIRWYYFDATMWMRRFFW
jgi:hypothetical protein